MINKVVFGQVSLLQPEAEELLLLLHTMQQREAAVVTVFTDSQALPNSLLTHYVLSGRRRALASPHTCATQHY